MAHLRGGWGWRSPAAVVRRHARLRRRFHHLRICPRLRNSGRGPAAGSGRGRVGADRHGDRRALFCRPPDEDQRFLLPAFRRCGMSSHFICSCSNPLRGSERPRLPFSRRQPLCRFIFVHPVRVPRWRVLNLVLLVVWGSLALAPTMRPKLRASVLVNRSPVRRPWNAPTTPAAIGRRLTSRPAISQSSVPDIALLPCSGRVG